MGRAAVKTSIGTVTRPLLNCGWMKWKGSWIDVSAGISGGSWASTVAGRLRNTVPNFSEMTRSSTGAAGAATVGAIGAGAD